MQLRDKVVVVTGAGSGIGRELTLQLLKQGARVAGVDVNPQSLSETQHMAKVGGDVFRGFPLDITEKMVVEVLPAGVVDHFGQVDGLINNAGIIQPFKPVSELTDTDINRVFDINLFGTIHLTRVFLPLLLNRPEAHIVNISSMGGFLPVPGQTIYGAAKAAVKLFTEGLYAELVDTSVHVTVVFPGAIETNIMENSGLGKPSGGASDAKESNFKALPASKAAEIILDAMEKNEFRVTVGSDAGFLDRLYRLMPKYATHFIQKKMSSLTDR